MFCTMTAPVTRVDGYQAGVGKYFWASCAKGFDAMPIGKGFDALLVSVRPRKRCSRAWCISSCRTSPRHAWTRCLCSRLVRACQCRSSMRTCSSSSCLPSSIRSRCVSVIACGACVGLCGSEHFDSPVGVLLRQCGRGAIATVRQCGRIAELVSRRRFGA